MQLLIPYAHVNDTGCVQAAKPLLLPNLAQLLRHLSLAQTVTGSADDLSPPHERQLARLLGLTPVDGRIPWAALELAQTGQAPGEQAHAWITPAHWQVGVDHILMRDPQSMALQEAESRALMQAMVPYFAQDGMALAFHDTGRWLASGPLLADLASASLDRVLGVDVSGWMPAKPALRRLQNEMQMLLYTHPVNDERLARGQEAVNSFWISGSGSFSGLPPSAPAPTLADGLRRHALQGDWAAWAGCWQEIDRTACAALLAEVRAGRDATLILCSERNALVFETRPVGWPERLRRRFQPSSLQQFTPLL